MTLPPDGADRRKHRRFTFSKSARVVLSPLNEESTGRLIDLSERGASITTSWAVTAGVGIFVSFTVGGRECEAVGSVIRVFPFGADYGLAVEFGVANDDFVDYLHELENAHEASRPDLLHAIEDLLVRIA